MTTPPDRTPDLPHVLMRMADALNHLVNLAEGEALRPGMYVVRLTQAGQEATRRVTVVP